MMKKHLYGDVWGDTVDLYDLGKGIIISVILSTSCFIGALWLIQISEPELTPNLASAYALLFGIGGCVLSAVVTAKLFKPKRIMNENKFSKEDQQAVLKELKIDVRKERKALETAEPAIIQEMKELELYEMFAGKDDDKKEGE